MKNLFTQRLAKLLLLMLICCPVVLSQLSHINYKSKLYTVKTNTFSFIVKEDYYNDELLEKLSQSPYSLALTLPSSRFVFLDISGDIMNINILDHYLKFEKEQFVEEVIPYRPGSVIPNYPPPAKFDIKGQVFQNGIPLTNHIVNLIQGQSILLPSNSIADEKGNYIFPDITISSTCDISIKVGNTRYTTTVVVDEDKILNLDIASMSGVNEKEFDVKGQIIYDGKPLANHTVNIYTNKFSYVYRNTTDEAGNYSFPNIIDYGDYTIFFNVGSTRYDTSFVLDENKTLDFNIGSVDIIDVKEAEEIPTTYSLSQNYPNPFNPTTTIQYSIPKDEFVKLTVYDITGRTVKELVNGYKRAGKYSIEFNASSYSSGTYYYKLEAGEYKSIQKMMLIK